MTSTVVKIGTIQTKWHISQKESVSSHIGAFAKLLCGSVDAEGLDLHCSPVSCGKEISGPSALPYRAQMVIV